MAGLDRFPNIALEHGGERARMTRYNPEDIIREYHTLRDVIVETLEFSSLKCRS